MANQLGYEEGATCNREGCAGTIQTRASDNCSCHLCAPCGSCTAPRNYCDECHWEEAHEPPEPFAPSAPSAAPEWDWWKPRTLADLDPSRIDWINSSHSSCSMVKEGVYPAGTDQAELRKAIEGTFGGRYEYNIHPADGKPGRFKYIAYTD